LLERILYKRGITGEGALVQVSMFESALDFQFEVLTCYYNDGGQLPNRSAVNNAHAYVAAPYGLYKTSDSYIALAMTDIVKLGVLLACEPLKEYKDSGDWFTKRDEIKTLLAEHLKTNTASHWLQILETSDIWCAPVHDYDSLTKEEGYRILNMELTTKTSSGLSVKTTRCPIRVDGKLLISEKGAPQLGEHNELINSKYELDREMQSVEKRK
jgi:CoA:oxalate CoA-transferase